MAEASQLGVMDSENLRSYKENYEGSQRNSVCDEIMKMKSDSFTVDMEPFSHLTNKDISFNSRINLQRNLSRKGSQIGVEKMMNNPSSDKDRDVIPSPKAASTVEKSMLVTAGTTDHHVTNSQVHHQITIMTGGAATTTTTNSGGTPTKSRLICKRSSSFKQSTIINPRRILFFFATLSSMGTILLIYFTLSIAKYNGDDNALDQ